jgi:predicted DNA binding protein
MHCFPCDKLTDNYETNKRTCASCREVLKIDLVRIIKEMDRIYLSESNRNKAGRKQKLTATQENDIKCAYEDQPKNGKISMKDLAKEYNVSVTTVSRTVHGQLSPPGMPRAK